MSRLIVLCMLVLVAGCATSPHPVAREERLYMQVRPYDHTPTHQGFMVDFLYVSFRVSDTSAVVPADAFIPGSSELFSSAQLPDTVSGVWTVEAPQQILTPDFAGWFESIFHEEEQATPHSRSALVGDRHVRVNHARGTSKSKFHFEQKSKGVFLLNGVFSLASDNGDAFIPFHCQLNADTPTIVFERRMPSLTPARDK